MIRDRRQHPPARPMVAVLTGGGGRWGGRGGVPDLAMNARAAAELLFAAVSSHSPLELGVAWTAVLVVPTLSA